MGVKSIPSTVIGSAEREVVGKKAMGWGSRETVKKGGNDTVSEPTEKQWRKGQYETDHSSPVLHICDPLIYVRRFRANIQSKLIQNSPIWLFWTSFD
jgi:hypothetical protein